jgi:hypothetical protein
MRANRAMDDHARAPDGMFFPRKLHIMMSIVRIGQKFFDAHWSAHELGAEPDLAKAMMRAPAGIRRATATNMAPVFGITSSMATMLVPHRKNGNTSSIPLAIFSVAPTTSFHPIFRPSTSCNSAFSPRSSPPDCSPIAILELRRQSWRKRLGCRA